MSALKGTVKHTIRFFTVLNVVSVIQDPLKSIRYEKMNMMNLKRYLKYFCIPDIQKYALVTKLRQVKA